MMPVALGQEPGVGEVEEARQQLPPREVAGDAEQDDDVVVGDRPEGLSLRHGWSGRGHSAHRAGAPVVTAAGRLACGGAAGSERAGALRLRLWLDDPEDGAHRVL